MFIILRKDNGTRVFSPSGKKVWDKKHHAKYSYMMKINQLTFSRNIKNISEHILYKTYNKEIVDIALKNNYNEFLKYTKTLGYGKYKNQFDMYFCDILEVISVVEYIERVINSYKGMFVENAKHLILADLNDIFEG